MRGCDVKRDERPMRIMRNLFATVWGWHFLTIMLAGDLSGQEISFNRDVRPILTKSCFACHGPDEHERQADLRLDDRDVAIMMEAILPGDAEGSSVVERIFSEDGDSIMPPLEAGHPLTESQKLILVNWIKQGAKYERHWAFEKPQRPEVPDHSSDWGLNPIDSFVWSKLESRGLRPSPSADRFTLVRRLYLDLIGMPPTVEEADAFAGSTDPLAYEKLVDQLLESPHYGERWAQPWLDLARYSDTNGYEKDRERSIWPYRDWVIRSFNDDLPYDQFSIEQLAGDMLPHPTPEQMVATGFHRNTMLNEEGGIDPLEYRYLAMVDRIATTGTVWLGLTVGCAQCHTHKYDPISHTDYFSLMAFLNNSDEPDFKIPDPARQIKIEKEKLAVEQVERDFWRTIKPNPQDQNEHPNRWSDTNVAWNDFNRQQTAWLKKMRVQAVAWDVIRPSEMKTNSPKLELLDDGSIFSSGDTTKRDEFEFSFEISVDADATKPTSDQFDQWIRAIRLEAIPDDRLPAGGPGRSYYEGRKGDFFLSEISGTMDGQAVVFESASHDESDASKSNPKTAASNVFDGDGSTGWRPGNRVAQRMALVLNLANPIRKSGTLKLKLLFERHYTASLGRFRISLTQQRNAQANRLGEKVERILAAKTAYRVGADSRVGLDGLPAYTSEQQIVLTQAFVRNDVGFADFQAKLKAAEAKVPRLTETMVFQERPADNPRPTFRHHRGEYLSPREPVAPAIPSVFADSSPEQVPRDRLEFAQWLLSDSNPIAARIAVNRSWREFFGAGLVRTNGDFGVQSEVPIHAGLLDWLSLKFRDDYRWSTKRLHRLIVTSQTYRISSEASAVQVENDPENRYLSRGPSFRLPGEVIRDSALRATGTLSTKMFGRGVRPPQPATVTSLAFGDTKWNASTGEDRFRRSIYTFKKRTFGFAAYSVFDGPSGESCTARRNRSNTPLQALTLLNDEMYLEMARALAKTLADRGKLGSGLDAQHQSIDQNITFVFRSFLTRPPKKSELARLRKYHDSQLARLEAGELKAEEIGGQASTAEQSALVMVVRAVMNLDEAITKR